MNLDPHHMRQNYSKGELLESAVNPDPIRQFTTWFSEATESGLIEPNAMTLSTITSDGRPDARIVLLKSIDPRGFVFFTNYDSRKGKQLSAHPVAALTFFWDTLERSVRIEGTVEKIARAESEAYFQSRPRMSQLGAWVSRQSAVISGREVLEKEMDGLQTRFGVGAIPTPPYWGGYRVIPDAIEFWQGRRSRLHDRLRYRRENQNWNIERLAP
ncbi:MAG: pyridoxamine 5'-phosphate oxidase [Phycisphaerae bacterium]|nr:pyridoxamine 5'-phosphate oxidase [Phycisphaerae bacterium]